RTGPGGGVAGRQGGSPPSTAPTAATSQSADRGAPAASRGAPRRERRRRPSCRSNRRRGPRRGSLRQCAAAERVEGRRPLLGGRSVRHQRGRAEGIAQARAGRSRSLRRYVANLLAHLRGLAVASLDLLEDLGGNAAGCAVLFEALEHLIFHREEDLEKLA